MLRLNSVTDIAGRKCWGVTCTSSGYGTTLPTEDCCWHSFAEGVRFGTSSPGFVPKPASSNLQPTPPTGSNSMDRPASLPSPKMWLPMIPILATDDCTSKAGANFLPHHSSDRIFICISRATVSISVARLVPTEGWGDHSQNCLHDVRVIGDP